jgi:hypothetical protein
MSDADETTTVEPEAAEPVAEPEPEAAEAEAVEVPEAEPAEADGEPEAVTAEEEPEAEAAVEEEDAETESEPEPEPAAEAAPEPMSIPMPARVARVFLCERGHRTTVLWNDPTTCQARPLRHAPVCGRQLYHITELPEQVQKALNPLKASKKGSRK